MKTNEEIEMWKKRYYDVADAVCRESTGVEDLCRQARKTREERDALRAALESIISTWDSEDSQKLNDLSDSLFAAINGARHILSNEQADL